MNKKLAIVILAAGKGTRMKSDQPKVMHKLAGLPMINWLLRTTAQLNPDRTIIVVGSDMAELEKAVSPHETIIQPVQNGTGGAVMAALPTLKGFDGDVLILLGDAPLITLDTLQNLIAVRREEPKTGIAVLGMELNNPAGYGRLILNDDASLKHIIEEKDANEDEKAATLCNTGAFCVDGHELARWLKSIDNDNASNEYYITDLPKIAATDGYKTFVGVTSNYEEVRGCNTRVDLAAMEGNVQKTLRQAAMNAGATLQDPNSVYFHHDTIIGKDVSIEPNVYFGANVKIGDNVEIKAFCHFEGASISDSVIIGPFARLRPGANLGQNVKIGNFVEVKQSQIGAGSKINHLAYVGDCEMGEETNFSAGAITVNYDGFQKHKTTIGKGVMIGSNVNLVAPVTIDDGAFIAAGSTITDDVPADALSMERAKAEVRDGWAAKYRKLKSRAKKSA